MEFSALAKYATTLTKRPPVGPVRAKTATRRITARQRQDLNFNGTAEAAEQQMKEKKLLLFQQKLDNNSMLRTHGGNMS